MREYRVVSSDSHLEVSPDRWRPYVDPEFREWVPTVVQLDDGTDAWLMPGSDRRTIPLRNQFGASWKVKTPRITTPGEPPGLTYAENPPGSGDGHQRLAEMDRDGVDADMLFPAVLGSRSFAGTPREAYVALARGYNDWLSQEYTTADPDRLLGVALLPASGVDDAIDEMRRVSTLPGIRCVGLVQWPNGSRKYDAEDDRFWQASVELGMPLVAHGLFGGGAAADLGVKDVPSLNREVMYSLLNKAHGGDVGHTVIKLMCEGVFERFPSLRFLFAETGVGWIPAWMEQLDLVYARNEDVWMHLELAHEPTWYVKHFIFGFQDDFYGVEQRHRIGVDSMAWGTDFPHNATDWPESLALIDRLFDGVPEDELRKMTGGNVLRHLRMDRAAAERDAVSVG